MPYRQAFAWLFVILWLCAAPAAVSAQVVNLRAGGGFDEGTPEPEGDGPKAIANWDTVPYQTVEDTLVLGVVAFHVGGIDRVEFSAGGGAWVTARRPAVNPDTGVLEYCARLDAKAADRDGPIEVRAIAYPTSGAPRLLEPLWLCLNGEGTLPEPITRYVEVDGDDESGDGSASRPFATIMRAARAIQDAGGEGRADGGVIYLGEGDHLLGRHQSNLTTVTRDRWLTIRPAPGVSGGKARVVGSASSSGIYTKLVKLEGLTIVSSLDINPPRPVLRANGPLVDYLWINKCDLVGLGRDVESVWHNGWSGVWVTDCRVYSCGSGVHNARLQRLVSVDNVGSDVFTGTKMVVNAWVSNVDKTGTGFHPDVAQYGPNTDNIILYNIEAKDNVGAQGFFTAQVSLSNVALVNVDIDNRTERAPGYHAFLLCGPTRHVLVRGSRFNGPSKFNLASGFTGEDIVVEDKEATFPYWISPDPPPPGVSYR